MLDFTCTQSSINSSVMIMSALKIFYNIKLPTNRAKYKKNPKPRICRIRLKSAPTSTFFIYRSILKEVSNINPQKVTIGKNTQQHQMRLFRKFPAVVLILCLLSHFFGELIHRLCNKLYILCANGELR